MARRRSAVLVAAVVLASCGSGEPPDDASAAVDATVTAPVTTAAVATSTPATEPTIPATGLSAMPFQNRLDVAKNLFQVKLFNRTDAPVTVTAAQFVWAGLTSAVGERTNTVPAGGRTDFPVPLAPATCHGEGDEATMPDLSSATVRLTLADGARRDVPVHDVKHVARRLYLQDCERQRIAAEVQIEWADLREVELDGRPVTEGVLRLVRRDSTTTVTLLFVSNTINFGLEWPDRGGSAAIAVLEAGAPSVAAAVRFVEGRCDAHALSESSQPFAFAAVVDLGDGVERSYIVTPPVEEQVPMKQRVERACEILGKTIFVGEGSESGP
jgi:hypothetical protein